MAFTEDEMEGIEDYIQTKTTTFTAAELYSDNKVR
jgi:hypothetical protein